MKKVKEIMVVDVVKISENATVDEAVKMMQNKGIGALIVERCDDGDSYGILTQRDIVYRVLSKGKKPDAMHVSEIHSKPAVVISPEESVEHAAQLMARIGISRAPVIRKQKLYGIITIKDIINKSM